MQNIDELIKQQRTLIIQMDQHHQKQINSLIERISRTKAQIQLLQNTENNEESNSQLLKNDNTQKCNPGMNSNSITPNSNSNKFPQEKLPKLNASFPR